MFRLLTVQVGFVHVDMRFNYEKCYKYGETEISQTPDTVFWASVYKAICGVKDAPEAVVK